LHIFNSLNLNFKSSIFSCDIVHSLQLKIDDLKFKLSELKICNEENILKEMRQDNDLVERLKNDNECLLKRIEELEYQI
jgi:invasion protein IalB